MLKGTPAALFQLDIFILGLHKSSSAWFTVKKKKKIIYLLDPQMSLDLL